MTTQIDLDGVTLEVSYFEDERGVEIQSVDIIDYDTNTIADHIEQKGTL